MPIPNSGQISLNDDVNATLEADANESDVSLGDNNAVKFTEIADGDTITGRSMSELRGQTSFEVFPTDEANGALGESLFLDFTASNHNQLRVYEPATTSAKAFTTKKATISFWFRYHEKPGSQNDFLFSAGSGDSDRVTISLNNNSVLLLIGSDRYHETADNIAIDTNGWYHMHLLFDSTEGNGEHRVRCWLNGIEVYWTQLNAYVSQNHNFNFGTNQRINSAFYNDAYAGAVTYADFKFIDGFALLPNQFGELKDGIWVPKAYAKPSTDTIHTSNLQVHYKFEGNFEDSTSNNKDGTGINNVTIKQTSGGSADFSGANSRMGTGYSFTSTQRTISMWVYATDTSARQYLFGDADTDGYDSQSSFSLQITTGDALQPYVGAGGSVQSAGNIDFSNYFGKWTHIVCVLNGTNVILYVDNQKYDLGNVTSNAQNGLNPMGLGSYSATGGANEFQGLMGEVQIYNTNLTDAQVEKNYNASKHLYAYGPYGWHLPLNNSDTGEIVTDNLNMHLDAGDWDADGTDETSFSGSTWHDKENSNDGTISGASYNSANGGYFDFDGDSDKITVSSSDLNPANTKSIEVWFNPDSTSSGYLISNWSGSGNTYGYHLYLTNGVLSAWVYSQAQNAYFALMQNGGTVTAGEWHHAVLNIGPNAIDNQLYLNGSLTEQESSTSGTFPTTAAHDGIFIGAYGAAAFYNGKIAQVRAYSKQLTAQEVVQNYRATQGHYKVLSIVDKGPNAKRVIAGGSNLTSAAHTLEQPTDNYPHMLQFPGIAGYASTTIRRHDKGLRAVQSNYGGFVSNVSVSTGKWYWETEILDANSYFPYYGVFSNYKETYDTPNHKSSIRSSIYTAKYGTSGNTDVGAAAHELDTAYAYNDGTILRNELDLDNGTFKMYKEGSSTAHFTDSGLPSDGSLEFVIGCHMSNDGGGGTLTSELYFNFGQNGFKYDIPSGFKSLSYTNLSTPEFDAIDKEQAADHFDVITYSGTSETNSITGLEFKPDLVWLKQLNSAQNHGIFDSVRGTHNFLSSNLTDGAETRNTDTLTSFDDNGFTVTGYSSDAFINYQGRRMVAYCWKAGGAAVSGTSTFFTNTEISANPDAGFSIVRFTIPSGNWSTDASYNHGLNSAPKLVITKPYSGAAVAADWYTYSEATTTSKYINLNSTSAQTTGAIFSSVDNTKVKYRFASSYGSSSEVITYNFTDIDGFSKIGSYEGNANANGPFVYTGFKPKFVMIKNVDDTGNWIVHDTLRNTSNKSTKHLRFNTTSTEDTGSNEYIEFHSNGFKLAGAGQNINHAETYIYMAFAEDPAKYSQGFGKTGNATEKFLDTDGSSSKKTEYPEEHFTTKLYTGTGSTRSIETKFKPGLVWIKGRSYSDHHMLYDSVRGPLLAALSSSSNKEPTLHTDTLTSFNSNGFTLGADATVRVNKNNATHVAWSWKAGDSNVEKKPTYTESGIYTTGLKLHYNFANDNTYSGSGTTVSDLTTNDNDATLINSPTFRTNAYGNYFDMDGANDVISTGDFTVGTNELTLELWVNPDSTQVDYANIIDYEHSNDEGWVVQQNESLDNQYYFAIKDGSTYDGATNYFNLTAGVWTHLVFKVDSSGNHTRYINGVEDFTATGWGGLANNTAHHLNIGSWGGNNGTTRSRYFNGKIGQVRIYDNDLTEAQIRANYNATRTLYQGVGTTADVVQTNLQLSYDIDDFDTYTSGSTIYDKTSNNHDGTITGSALGKSHVGKYLDFDGTASDYITVAHDTVFNLDTDTTLEFWVKRDTTSGERMIMGKGLVNWPYQEGWFLGWTASYGYYFFDYETQSYARSGVSATSQGWEHVVLVWNSSTKTPTIYVNSKKEVGLAQVTGTGSAGTADTNPLVIAKNNSSYTGYTGWIGEIAQIRFYTKALSAADVKSNYDATKAQFYSPLIHSTVSVNDKAGFSIASYNAIGAAGSVSHGMTGDSEFVIIKNRDQADDWAVYHKSNGGTKYNELNTAINSTASSNMFNNSDFTNSTFNIATNHQTGAANENYISYHWRSIPGYSKIGLYKGSGGAGNKVITGFKPAFVMIKSTGSQDGWIIWDDKRGGNKSLFPHSEYQEVTGTYDVDFNSDGFTVQSTNTPENANGYTYIYLAIAR